MVLFILNLDTGLCLAGGTAAGVCLDGSAEAGAILSSITQEFMSNLLRLFLCTFSMTAFSSTLKINYLYVHISTHFNFLPDFYNCKITISCYQNSGILRTMDPDSRSTVHPRALLSYDVSLITINLH